MLRYALYGKSAPFVILCTLYLVLRAIRVPMALRHDVFNVRREILFRFSFFWCADLLLFVSFSGGYYP